MKLKKSVLTAIISAAVGLGTTGQAMAGVYAGSAGTFSNFFVGLSPTPAGTGVNNFDFASTNTAQLNNGPIAASGGTCGGTVPPLGPAANDCGVVGSTSVLAGDVLSFGAVNAAGSTVNRGTNDYTTKFGPGGQQYANSNSRIEDSQLTEGIPTAAQQIAEAEIQTGISANSNAEISSLTSFTFVFTLANPGSLSISFIADKYLLADVNDATAATASARASIETRFTLSGGSQFWQWQPGANCIEAGGVTGCLGQVASDAFSLNDSAQVSGVPVSSENRSAGPAAFSASANGLLAGTYSLTLFTKGSVVVRRSIPEPSTLFLLGAGLAGLSFGRRYRKS